MKLYNSMLEHQSDLANIITMENGKVIFLALVYRF